MVCFILNNEIINSINAATIIDGPEGVLKFSDENNPKNTDNKPPITENIIMPFGLFETFLAIAAGIINIPVINNNPIIFIDIAIIAVSYTHLTLPTTPYV